MESKASPGAPSIPGHPADCHDAVRLARPLPQQVPEVSTHFWLIWFDWSRLVGNISQSRSKQGHGTEQAKGHELGLGTGVDSSANGNSLFTHLLFTVSAKSHCARAWEYNKLYRQSGRRRRQEATGSWQRGFCLEEEERGCAGPGDPASSQPGLPGAILRDPEGAAVLSHGAEPQLCPGAEPGFKGTQGRGCAPPRSSLQGNPA